MWDPPLAAGTLDSLQYHVIVANNDTGVVIVNRTTTVKTQPLYQCSAVSVYYTANVTAFSSEHHGDSMVTGERSLGGMCVCGVHAHVQVFVCKVVCMSSMFITKCWFCYVVRSTVVFSIGLNLKV